jgi:hypothetical protein
MLAAADILGGIEALADLLQTPRDELLTWITGTEQPAEMYFLAAVDVILGDHELLRKTFHQEQAAKRRS